MEEVLVMNNIYHSYLQGEEKISILEDIDFSISEREIVAIVGHSGSGKSTFLHIAGLLETPKSGEIFICGENVTKLNEKEKAIIRRKNIGYIYQSHQLLEDFSALENVMLPQIIAGVSESKAKNRAMQLLEIIGLKNRVNHRPNRMSGGEQQRVAVARALANKPRIVIADEPTGNLDNKISAVVFAILIAMMKYEKISAIISTHSMDLANNMDKIYRIHNGDINRINRI